MRKIRKTIYSILILSLCLGTLSTSALSNEKKRVIVLTDIENEPDDAMSLIRFLTYSNEWDTEGLIATTSIHQKNKLATWRIREIIDAYGKVRNNLLIHDPNYPTHKQLYSVIKEGKPNYGMSAVGKHMDSEGSELIIQTVDHPDSRPVWILVWGGPNCLAQALWKVKNTRTAKEVEEFIKKLRVYTISDQDDSGPWIRKTFKNLFYIVSPGYHPYGGYHHATWSGIGGDKFHGRFCGADYSIVDNLWLDENIRCKGELGAQYPEMKFMMEGDSPTFLYLINNGLGNSEKPNWGSWGGRYEYYQPRTERWFLEEETRPIWADAIDEVIGVDKCWHTSNKATIWRWREAFQNDFASRMDWCIKSYEEANHPPIPKLNHEAIRKAKIGEKIYLDAEKSSDPDGDTLNFHWFYYPEAGSFTLSSGRTGNPITITNSDQSKAWFTVPNSQRLGTIHIILAVTDNGSPSLTRYKRVIIDITE